MGTLASLLYACGLGVTEIPISDLAIFSRSLPQLTPLDPPPPLSSEPDILLTRIDRQMLQSVLYFSTHQPILQSLSNTKIVLRTKENFRVLEIGSMT